MYKGAEYCTPDNNLLSHSQMEAYEAFCSFLVEKSKADEIMFLYRGDRQRDIKKRLSGQTLTDLFFFGDKARHFFKDKHADDRDYLNGINDCSRKTFREMFDRIAGIVKRERFKERLPAPFVNFFAVKGNESAFCNSVQNIATEENRLKVRDYYLYLLHTGGSAGVRKETVLVSTSTQHEMTRHFSCNSKREIKDSSIVHYYLPRPYEFHCIAPWLLSANYSIVTDIGLPTYNPKGLFPDQFEVAVKGALFPHFIIGVWLRTEKRFIVNPAILTTPECDFEYASQHGLSIDQSNFEKLLTRTNYLRGVYSYQNGKYDQFENQGAGDNFPPSDY
ncbi:hypothetical protein [Pseudodesulfovibrio sp. zrk46]|uniref:hypothetical protein n=1 Tax=Pseudodesulfovibrio sp. zrk46 TaxID=2725288 RepID=UPI0014497B3F|nr:hypothetical protein [Pseudodesulfovibrio sp. zrk46]QJB56559.1 hypothetical protein HFN16_09115 [Pseudodesulfovibrio sp. zrk46]